MAKGMSADQQMAQERLMEEIRDAIGTTCEIKSPDNVLACLGKVDSVIENAVNIVSAEGGEMLPVVFNTQFKLVLRPPNKPMLVLKGSICGSSRVLWRLDKLDRFSYEEGRNYFRQSVSSNGLSCCINGLYQPEFWETIATAHSCRVMNISLGGMQIRTQGRYERGDWIIITDVVLIPEDKKPYKMIGEVCWVERAVKEEFLYGCRFLPLSEKEQDKLSADIFEIQRRDIQARRQR